MLGAWKTTKRMVVMLILLALVLGAIFGWKFWQMQKMQEQMSQPEPPIKVEATQLKAATWRPEIKAVGSLRAINGVEVANEVAGVVSQIDFESGDQVKKGDLLIQIEDSVDRAALAAAQARADLAQETFNRFSNLIKQNAVSRSQYDEARSNRQATQAEVEELRAQLNKKAIRAPFDGVVGLRRVDLGQYIAVGTPIVDLNMLEPIYVDYSVPERLLTELAPGRQVEISVAAYPEQVFAGEVMAISPSINQSSRTLDVRAQLPNDEQLLRPGMFADVRSLAPEEKKVLTLPRTALSFNTYGNFVFLITENENGEQIAKRVSVTTGNTRGNIVEITDGLQQGDRVVATGLLRLRDGQRVEIQQDSAQGEKNQESGAQGEEATG
ncbi:efflux RND transporter periplasmic adaptor subunit [Pistricoccus aurantiacus]|uniref:Efflux RND transporter periplasmic adaptor subunit n=2 Tax=Pistricoccus aurantiacus TaxID=1883414 RepID=A0A5B8SUK2_9GAMM|nr:efflux RND transporter periplasmic adaptor subunit [Pistricoccus aurantiacus]